MANKKMTKISKKIKFIILSINFGNFFEDKLC